MPTADRRPWFKLGSCIASTACILAICAGCGGSDESKALPKQALNEPTETLMAQVQQGIQNEEYRIAFQEKHGRFHAANQH